MSNQSASGVDRACEVHHCTADPCVLHREDEATTYIDETRPYSDPCCDSCGVPMETKALASGGNLDCVRHKFACPDCGEIVVINEYEAQRQLTEFGGPDLVSDGGRVEDGTERCGWCERQRELVDHEYRTGFLISGPDGDVLTLEYGRVCRECWNNIKRQWSETGDLKKPLSAYGGEAA